MPANSQHLSTAIEAVTAAQEVLNKYYQADVRAQIKADKSPVTIADQEAERVIQKTISAVFPSHSFLGEETGSTKSEENPQESEYLWIIDPIDCTKHYLRQIPLFATELALMKDGEIILGVSNAPKLGELIYAEKGRGAFLNNEPISVSNISKLEQAYLSYSGIGYFQSRGIMENLLKLEQETLGHRGIGDFWSYHLLAQGKIDIMIEAETKIWDVAAVTIIVEEAGGKVTDLQGKPVNLKTNSVLASNGLLHQKLISLNT